MPNYDAPLKRVLETVRQVDLAAHLGINPSAIPQWRRVPAHHVQQVAAFTGIPPAELRPDVFEPVPMVTSTTVSAA